MGSKKRHRRVVRENIQGITKIKDVEAENAKQEESFQNQLQDVVAENIKLKEDLGNQAKDIDSGRLNEKEALQMDPKFAVLDPLSPEDFEVEICGTLQA